MCEIQIPRPPHGAMVWGQGQEGARLARARGRTGGVWASPVIAGAPGSPPHTPRETVGTQRGRDSRLKAVTQPQPLHVHISRRPAGRIKGRKTMAALSPSPSAPHCPAREEPGSPRTRGHIQAWPGKPPPTRRLSRLSRSQGHPQGTRAQTTPVDEVAGVGLVTQGCPNTSCPFSAGLQAAPPSQLHSFTIS